MNILLMANHFNTGGITSYLLNLSSGLSGKGHKVLVASANGNCVPLVQVSGVRHAALDIRVKSEAHPKLWLAIPYLARLIQEEQIDIIHVNTRVTQVMASIASRLTGRPFVSTCHGFFKPRLSRRVFPCWGRGVIAVSNGVRDHLINDFKLDAGKVYLIPNGIDTAQFAVDSKTERPIKRRQWGAEGNPIIGIIARLSGVKGIDVLINAFPLVLAEFPQCRLWIIGEGSEKEYLQGLVENKGLSGRVRFEPIVNRSADILPIFDVFVMPSLQEGLGLSVMEAQAAGIPVIVSDVGGLPDLVEDNKTGMLFPSGQSDVLAGRIIDVLKQPRKANAMAEAARLRVNKEFSLEHMTTRTLNFYEQYL